MVLGGKVARIVSVIEGFVFRWKLAYGQFGTYNLAVNVSRVPESFRRNATDIIAMSNDLRSILIDDDAVTARFRVECLSGIHYACAVDSRQPC